jgi:hypothetical protein
MSGAFIGAEAGGEIGAFAGPFGALAGIVIGGLIGLGATVLAAKAVTNANDKAEEGLKGATTPCSDCQPPDCKEAQRKIKKTRDELKKRYAEMRKDKIGMYKIHPEKTPFGSWQGHIDQFIQKQKNLRKLIAEAQNNGCSIPGDAWKWATEKPPTKPAPIELNA